MSTRPAAQRHEDEETVPEWDRWDLTPEQRWARDPRVLDYWQWVREEKPWLPLPDWYVRYVLQGEYIPAPRPSPPTPQPVTVADKPRPDPAPVRAVPHCLRTTGAMTTPIANLTLATKAGSRRVVGINGRVVQQWIPSQVEMLDLLDVLTRSSFAARRWPSVSGAGRWARRWGHEALNSEPRGDDTLRELGNTGILLSRSKGSMKRYILEDRGAALQRFGELYGFTLARG